MKKPRYHHKAKLKTKQPDLISYLSKLLLGAVPLICYFMILKSFIILNDIGISFTLPKYFLFSAYLIFISSCFYILHTSPLSFSVNQRMINKLKKIIEVNNFYYENKETHKITLSMVIKFYWMDNKLHLEIYPSGGQFTNKMNELTSTFQTALNMTVIAVQDDHADHTTYILTKKSSSPINVTNNWE